jgi:hypothetical protein
VLERERPGELEKKQGKKEWKGKGRGDGTLHGRAWGFEVLGTLSIITTFHPHPPSFFEA